MVPTPKPTSVHWNKSLIGSNFADSEACLRLDHFGIDLENDERAVLQLRFTNPDFSTESLLPLDDEEIEEIEIFPSAAVFHLISDETAQLNGASLEISLVSHNESELRSYAKQLFAQINQDNQNFRALNHRIETTERFILKRLDVLQRKLAAKGDQSGQLSAQAKELIPILRILRGETD